MKLSHLGQRLERAQNRGARSHVIRLAHNLSKYLFRLFGLLCFSFLDRDWLNFPVLFLSRNKNTKSREETSWQNYCDNGKGFKKWPSHPQFLARANAPAAILPSVENTLSNPFPSEPSIVFSPQKPFYSQSNYSS